MVRSGEHQLDRFVRYEALVKIRKSQLAFGSAIVDIHAGKSVAAPLFL